VPHVLATYRPIYRLFTVHSTEPLIKAQLKHTDKFAFNSDRLSVTGAVPFSQCGLVYKIK